MSSYGPFALLAATLLIMPLPAFAAEPAGAGPCLVCHTVDAPPSDPMLPQIAGMRKKHLLAALQDYRSGDRQHAEMEQAVRGLDDAVLEEIAAWYAEQPWIPGAGGAIDAELAKAGSRKARASCSSCHRASGAGALSAPRLGGQSVGYLDAAHRAYRDGTRTSPTARGKAFVMKSLTDEQIRALSHYYASLR